MRQITPPRDVLGSNFPEWRRRADDALDDLARPDGASIAETMEVLRALIDELDTTVAEQIAAQSYTRAQIDAANQAQDAATVDVARISGVLLPAKGGTGITNAYNNDLSASTRRTAWVTDAGVMGYAPSTRASKRDIVDAEFTADQYRTMTVSLYRYRSAVAREQLAAEFPCVAAPFQAPTEIGLIADDLHDAGLWPFVMYDGRGNDARPAGIHVELIGLAALHYAQHLHTAIDDLADRVTRIEQNGQPS